jgi:hypothetical protein
MEAMDAIDTIILVGAALYVLVAAVFLGMFSAEDYYKGLTPNPKSIALNLLMALLWPPLLLFA